MQENCTGQILRTLCVNHLPVALHNPSHGVGFFPGAIEHGLRFLELLGGNHQQHAESHVKGAEHFVARYIAQLLQMLEDGQYRPGAGFDDGRRQFEAKRAAGFR